MRRVLVVSVEPPWPSWHGGRIRTARLAEALGRHVDVLVAYPDHGGVPAMASVPTRALPWTAPSEVRTRGSMRPHLGGHFLSSLAAPLVALTGEFRPDVVYWSHSYLAAWSPRRIRHVPCFVEFANIESDRLRTLVTSARGLRRAARGVEARKARWWEPRTAARASLCVALSEPDLAVLRRWAKRVVLVPNGVDVQPYTPSPPDGYVLALASYDYEPNVTALRQVVGEIWPLVRARVPAARLVVAGRRSETLRDELAAIQGVAVLGTLDVVSATYGGASVSLAPASTGGGAQLKMTESLAHGRSVVLSPFGARGLPSSLRDCEAFQVADSPEGFASAIITGLTDVPGRHAREHSGWQRCGPLAWSGTIGPLVDAIEALP